MGGNSVVPKVSNERGVMRATRRRVTREEAQRAVIGPSIQLQEWPRKAVDWLCAGREDYEVFRHRKGTRRHRVLRQRCKNIWIVAGVAMMLNPLPSVMLVMTLVASLLSFAVLDETEELP
jgi:hypothetical protein